MVSSQIIRGCLEQLRTITRIEFCLQDITGNVVAQTEGAEAPDKSMAAGFAQSAADSQIIGNSFYLKVMDDDELQFVLTAQGTAEHTFMVAKIAASEIENLIVAYKEKFDRNNFFQNLLLDNLLLVDIHNRSKKLHIAGNVRRAIILFEVKAESEQIASEMLSGLFTIQNGDYLTEVDENSVILIKALEDNEGYKEIEDAAKTAVDMLNMEAMIKVRGSYSLFDGIVLMIAGHRCFYFKMIEQFDTVSGVLCRNQVYFFQSAQHAKGYIFQISNRCCT